MKAKTNYFQLSVDNRAAIRKEILDTALRFGLFCDSSGLEIIIGELLANSLRHAYKKDSEGIICIEYITNNIYSSLVYKDYGTGFTYEEKKVDYFNSTGGMGLSFLKEIVGKECLFVDSHDHFGTTVTLIFKDGDSEKVLS